MTHESQANLEIIRTRPQNSKLFLSIFQPQIIFQARINDSTITKGARVITYNAVSLGSYTSIQNGFTMWIGTTPGAQDVGKIRVRSATSSQITVSENANISWRDSLYLTIFYYVELWPIYPRIIQDPSNSENVIFYKDYDIVYSNQNSILGTYVNAGPHRATFLDPASGQARIWWSSTGSHNLLGDSLNYNWWFQGATVTGSSASDPGYITYTQPGHYVTRLIISGSSGEIDTTYRYVSVYNAANPPIQKWEFGGLTESRADGGGSLPIKVFEIIPIQENAVVVISKQTEYGNTQINLGGNYPNAGDIFFVGYVDKDSISYDYEHSEVSFDAVSLSSIMKKTSGFSVSVESKLTPTKWYELYDMDSRRALYHYLKWHTTAMMIADFQFVGTDYKIQYFDSNRESMYDAIHSYMSNTMVGNVVSDRQGKIWMEVDAQAYPNPTGSFLPASMEVTRRDWMNTPSIEERLSDERSYLEYGGIAYSGVNTGTFTPLMSEAPGNAPGFYGTLESHQGLALLSQSQLNQLTGNLYANGNTPYPTINMDMANTVNNLDIAPQETLDVHILPEDTVRNVAIDSPYIVDSMNWKYDPKDFGLFASLEAKQLVTGDSGNTVIIPAVDTIGEGWSISSFNLPPYPTNFTTVPSENGDGGPRVVLVHDPTAGWILTTNFNSAVPAWFQINAGLTLTQYQDSNKVVVCPNGSAYMVKKGPGGGAFIARADSLGGFWTVVMDNTALVALYGSGVTAGIVDLTVDPAYPERLGLALTSSGAAVKLYLGSQSTWSFKQIFSDWGSSPEGTLSIAGVPALWVLTGGSSNALPFLGAWAVYDQQFAGLIRNGRTGGGGSGFVRGCGYHVRSLNRVVAYTDESNLSYTITENAFITQTENISLGNAPTPVNSLGGIVAISPNGNNMCARATASNRIRSFDGGYSWSPLANLPVLVAWCFDCDPTNDSMWVAAGSYVFYTPDFWNSYPIDKQGNLPQINPLYSMNFVKVIQH